LKHTFYSPSDYDHIDPKNIRIEKVSNEKKHPTEILFNQIDSSSNDFFPCRLFKLLEERAEELLQPEKEEPEDTNDSLYLAVEKFISLLEQLKKANISENYLFAEELSQAWLTLNEYASMNRQQRTPPAYYRKLKSFLYSAVTYPEKSDHTFGYYLNQYAGEKWLPFPFIDLLSKLHEETLLLKEKSTLSAWITSLTTVLKHLSCDA
jgi:hypothetical protein